jgi:hypothetical protein
MVRFHPTHPPRRWVHGWPSIVPQTHHVHISMQCPDLGLKGSSVLPDRLYGVKFVATPSQPRSRPCHGNRV